MTPGWPPLAQVEVVERSDGRVKLVVDQAVALDELLAAASRSGEVRRFAHQPPKLSDLFMEVVAEAPEHPQSQAAPPGGSAGPTT